MKKKKNKIPNFIKTVKKASRETFKNVDMRERVIPTKKIYSRKGKKKFTKGYFLNEEY